MSHLYVWHKRTRINFGRNAEFQSESLKWNWKLISPWHEWARNSNLSHWNEIGNGFHKEDLYIRRDLNIWLTRQSWHERARSGRCRRPKSAATHMDIVSPQFDFPGQFCFSGARQNRIEPQAGWAGRAQVNLVEFLGFATVFRGWDTNSLDESANRMQRILHPARFVVFVWLRFFVGF